MRQFFSITTAILFLVTDLISASTTITEYCTGMVFRETPYADIRCTRRLSKSQLASIKHFQLDYDALGRLIEVRYNQNDLPYINSIDKIQ